MHGFAHCVFKEANKAGLKMFVFSAFTLFCFGSSHAEYRTDVYAVLAV